MASINMKLGIILAGLVVSIPVMGIAQESGKRNLDRFTKAAKTTENAFAYFKRSCVGNTGQTLLTCCETAKQLCPTDKFGTEDCDTAYHGCLTGAFWTIDEPP